MRYGNGAHATFRCDTCKQMVNKEELLAFSVVRKQPTPPRRSTRTWHYHPSCVPQGPFTELVKKEELEQR